MLKTFLHANSPVLTEAYTSPYHITTYRPVYPETANANYKGLLWPKNIDLSLFFE